MSAKHNAPRKHGFPGKNNEKPGTANKKQPFSDKKSYTHKEKPSKPSRQPILSKDTKRSLTDHNEDIVLKEQIVALGGNLSDLKFLDKVDLSDDDDTLALHDTAPSGIDKELLQYMANIGLNPTSQSIEIDTNEPDLENDQDQEQDSSDSDEDLPDQAISNKQTTAPTAVESKERKRLLIDPTPLWFETKVAPVEASGKISPAEVTEKYSYAKALLLKENELAEKRGNMSSSDRAFMSNMIQSGTLDDRVSAMILLIQESPLHGLSPLRAVMAMTRKKSKKESELAAKSLKDLFIGTLLPDRKLVHFADQPLGSPAVTDKHLLLWVFEDHLKKTYFEFIQQLEVLSYDTLWYIRLSVGNCLYDMLVGKPEQEQNLLKLLINKLGDMENKVASKASHLLVNLLVQHPGMKIYVVREIEQLLLRSNASERAKYYAIITLNQTILTGKDTAVANKLIEIYFFFFKTLLNISDKEEQEAKSNEFDDGEEDDEAEEEVTKKDKKKKKGQHKSGKRSNANKQAPGEVDERHAKPLTAILTGVKRAFHFADMSESVFDKHMDILFKITHTGGTFNMVVQSLSLIFSIITSKQAPMDRYYRALYESMLDPRIPATSKQAMYLNLLFKSIRADSDPKRIKAFVKRLLQIAAHHQPAFICGLLTILSQLMQVHSSLHAMLTSPEEEDDEEHFVDAPDDDDDIPTGNKPKNEDDDDDDTQDQKTKEITYDGRKRDPRFSNADRTCLWELTLLKNHYHPAVAKYCKDIIANVPIENNIDLHHFTLMHFLDRFVYRNPKKQETTKGGSIMQPLGKQMDGGILFTRRGGVNSNSILLNSQEFCDQGVDQVPADEVFFHTYFNQRAKRQPPKKEEEEEGDEEDQIWRAMTASIPGGVMGEDDSEGDDFDDDEMRALLLENEDDEVAPSDHEEDEQDEEFDFDSDDSGMGAAMGIDSDQEGDSEGEGPLLTDSDNEDDPMAGVKRTSLSLSDKDVGVPSKKRRRQKLPTFASLEDYAHLLDQDEA